MTKALEVRNVSKVWPEITALTNVNFSLENSEIHSIIGPNGAGKSTFFGVISGELEPTEGEVWFGGQMVNKIPAWKRTRMGMSRAFQVPKVFPGLSIEENLLVSLRIEEKWKDRLKAKGFWKPSAASMKKTEEFLKEVGLYEQREKNVKNISHGDKKDLKLLSLLLLSPNCCS